MPLSSDKLSRMAEHQRRLQRQKADAVAVLKSQAREEIQALVSKFLLLDPTISRIILFGSLARNDVSSPDFDIDLAVSCSGERFLTLVAIALNSPFKVDVVDLSTADERIKSAVAREGIVFYEK